MNIFFVLSKENIELAKEEVFALFNYTEFKLLHNILLLNAKISDIYFRRIASRLAYTRSAYVFLFMCDINDLNDNIARFNWSSIYKNDFSVRVSGENNNLSEKQIASLVWNKLKDPKVNLKDGYTNIHFFVFDNVVVCGLRKHVESHDFQKRRSHLRPNNYPVSLHPKLARACVNLVGIKKNDILLDPFCGTGGILIEAGLMNMKVIGFDINEKMLKISKCNFEFSKLRSFHLFKKDATIKDSYDIDFNAIVTDLPYGKSSTSLEDLDNIYLKFLEIVKSLKQSELIKRCVVIFPDFIDYKKIFSILGLEVKKEFSFYIHKSLTRKIVVF